MNSPVFSPIVYTPQNINELNGYARSNPKASIFSGGTYILPLFGQKKTGDSQIIDISKVEELQRISRTEGYIEVGAGVTLNRILEVGKRILPKNLKKAIRTIGNSIIRDLATIGGNIGNKDIITTLPPVLLPMDVKVEIRRNNITRWFSLNQIYTPGRGIDLNTGEFVQRIRIPAQDWDFQVFRAQGSFLEDDRFMFCTFASVQKGIITNVRMTFCSGWHTYIRPREIEAEMEGRKLPFSRNDITTLREHFHSFHLKTLENLEEYQLKQISRTFYWVLHELSYFGTE